MYKCGGCSQLVEQIGDTVLGLDARPHHCPSPPGALTTEPYLDNDGFMGVRLTFHQVNDGADVTVRLGHTQAAALSAACRPNGRPIIIHADGNVTLRPGVKHAAR